MRVPWTFWAVPPLLILYPLSYFLGIYRVLIDPLRPTSTQLLTRDGLVNPLAVTPPLAARISDPLLQYAEDLVVWGDIVLFSTDPGRPIYDPFTNEGDAAAAGQGAIIAYDLGTGTSQALSIQGWPEGRELHNLGLGLREVSDTEALLGIANAGAPGVDVLKLTRSEGHVEAQHVRSIDHTSLVVPNSLVLLSETQVLVTNSFYLSPRSNPILSQIETMLALPMGYTLLLTAAHNGTQAEVVGHGLPLANGIALSDDGRLLTVIGCTGSEAQIYDVEPSPGALSASDIQYRETLPLGFLADNVRFVPSQADGYMFLAAGHPAGLDFIATADAKGKGKLAGSRVVKFSVRTKHSVSIKEELLREANRLFTRVDKRVYTVFEDDGGFLGTACTAAVIGDGEIIVTGLWETRGAVKCSGVDLW